MKALIASALLLSTSVSAGIQPPESHQVFRAALPGFITATVVDHSAPQYVGTLLESNDLQVGQSTSRELCIALVQSMKPYLKLSGHHVAPKYQKRPDARILEYTTASFYDGSSIEASCTSYYNKLTRGYQYLYYVRSHGSTNS